MTKFITEDDSAFVAWKWNMS